MYVCNSGLRGYLPSDSQCGFESADDAASYAADLYVFGPELMRELAETGYLDLTLSVDGVEYVEIQQVPDADMDCCECPDRSGCGYFAEHGEEEEEEEEDTQCTSI